MDFGQFKQKRIKKSKPKKVTDIETEVYHSRDSPSTRGSKRKKKIRIDENKMIKFLKTLSTKEYPMLKNLIYRAKSNRKTAYISESVYLFNNFLDKIIE